ncbi:MAG: helix-hairpin-helix domain-containing protein [Steroidobacteraceae bacterium]
MALGVAAAGFLIYRNAGDDRRPVDGSLIVNINTATPEELETVPGVGPTRALQIIGNRPYATVDDLQRVYGIAPQQVEEMRPYVKVEGKTEKR